jgi:hypothetical protein
MNDPGRVVFKEQLCLLDELFYIEVKTNKHVYLITKGLKRVFIKKDSVPTKIPLDTFLDYIKAETIVSIISGLDDLFCFLEYKLT